jgi:hypothetical protein
MATDFLFSIYESYGDREADQLMEAFAKVSSHYAK